MSPAHAWGSQSHVVWWHVGSVAVPVGGSAGTFAFSSPVLGDHVRPGVLAGLRVAHSRGHLLCSEGPLAVRSRHTGHLSVGLASPSGPGLDLLSSRFCPRRLCRPQAHACLKCCFHGRLRGFLETSLVVNTKCLFSGTHEMHLSYRVQKPHPSQIKKNCVSYHRSADVRAISNRVPGCCLMFQQKKKNV